MTRLFHREVALTVSKVVSADKFFQTRDEVTIRDLRVAFSIEKNLESTPNTCTATVYNLSQASRAELHSDGLQVRLLAGYDGSLASLFVGDLDRATSKLNGATWETRLELGDGTKAHRHGRVERSFKAGADALTLLNETAKSMDLALPTSLADATGMQDKLSGGIVLSGPSQAEMTRLLKAKGFGWSIQDGVLQVLPHDGATTVEAILVSVDTGMVGTPEMGVPEAKGKPAVLTIAKKIDPGALPTPGGRILVDARDINGLFVVRRVTHVGDTGGSEWVSQIEAVAA